MWKLESLQTSQRNALILECRQFAPAVLPASPWALVTMNRNMRLSSMAALIALLTIALPARAQQPPEIRTQPVSQTVLAGTDVQFTVSATGHKPLSYQWRFNAVPVNGATNEVLFLAGVAASDAGSYSVVFINAVGSTTSVTA